MYALSGGVGLCRAAVLLQLMLVYLHTFNVLAGGSILVYIVGRQVMCNLLVLLHVYFCSNKCPLTQTLYISTHYIPSRCGG